MGRLHVLWLCLAGLDTASFFMYSYSSTLAQAPLKVGPAHFLAKTRERGEAQPHNHVSSFCLDLVCIMLPHIPLTKVSYAVKSRINGGERYTVFLQGDKEMNRSEQ